MKRYLKVGILWLVVVPCVILMEWVVEIISIPFRGCLQIFETVSRLRQIVRENLRSGRHLHRETMNPGCHQREAVDRFLRRQTGA